MSSIASSAICVSVLVLSACITAADISRPSAFDNLSVQRHEIWAGISLSYVRNISCDRAFFAVPDQCKRMKQTPSDQMNVYSAEAGRHRKIMAALPDGTLSKAGAHDGIVVIDPFPAASYGHLVIAFFVDRLDRSACEMSGGIYIETHNDCLRLVLKDGCHNLLTMPQRFQNQIQRHATHKLHRCEVDFLPFVYEVAGNSITPPRKNSHSDEQRLQCQEAAGFARCPMHSASSGVRTARNVADSSSTEDEPTPSIRCLLFEICDHALVVHGSWGRLSDRRSDFGLLSTTKRMLSQNGFVDGNIKLFYKDGIADESAEQANQQRLSRRHDPDATVSISPSSNKRMMRSYVQSACSKLHCVDTFAVFLKGPALHDGSLLLFDADGDGLASEPEKYSVHEIASDLANCTARRVFVVADYSYSGRLSTVLEEEQRLFSNGAYDNVIVVTSGDAEQYSWGNQFSTMWINENHRSTCFKNIFQTNKDLISLSNPTIFDGSGDTSDEGTTLSGAPCNLYPPLTDTELRERYLGCNNVPSWFWFQSVTNATSAGSLRRLRARRK